MKEHSRSNQKVAKRVTDSIIPSGANGSGRLGTRPRQTGFGAETTGGKQVGSTPVLEEEKQAAEVSAELGTEILEVMLCG